RAGGRRARVLERPVAERSGELSRHPARNGEDPHTERTRAPRGRPGWRAGMTQPPYFEQIVDSDEEGAQPSRLPRVHSLLVQAGPPPELSPELESGPTLGMTLGRRPPRVRRRVLLLAAAVAIIALAFLGGYIAGNGGSTANAEVLKLTVT